MADSNLDKGAARSPWVVSPAFDLGFFWGASAAGLTAAALMLIWPALVLPLTWLWLTCLEGPHLIATWQRVYLDAEERRQWRGLLPWSILCALGGVILLAVSELTGQPAIFDLLLAIAALLAWDHTLRQHWGVYSLYAARHRQPQGWWRFDHHFLHIFLWYLLIASLFAVPVSSANYLPWLAPAWRALGRQAVTVVTALALAGYAFSVWLRWRRGVPWVPGLFALLCIVGMLSFLIFGVGPFEPLLGWADNPEQCILAMTLAGGVVHGVQYMGVVFAANRGRVRAAGDAVPASALGRFDLRLGRQPLLFYLGMVGISIGYAWLNAARGTMPGWNLFPSDSLATKISVALYWGLFLHHFLLDHFIWRVRTNPRLRAELGFR